MCPTKMGNGIFVYGTLMSGFENHEIYLAKNIKSIQKAKIKGRLFHLRQGYPAVIDGPGCVRGEYVTVNNISSVLEQLDELEDYYGPGKNNEYERVSRDIMLISGKTVRGYVYIYPVHLLTELNRMGRELPAGDWRAFITGHSI